MYWIEQREREEGYDRGYTNGKRSMEESVAEQLKQLSECQKKMEQIKKIYEDDESFKSLKIKKIIYGKEED